ncbi:hypothetical protein I5M27_06050 [Adhaeribacter sp. BT258]|uniref:Uncharacterized protein n=1 Tax=Adhaeribacter terrigena TaxID=2793070 RepID=A0ABS1BZM4_9BACT|nr:hypothetical protein [Adhaeribacter terrigena]MBK0402539.1 hypothetical protein [Adhaeribacter terrigena]
MIMLNKRISAILITVALILSIPLIAMQFTDEVDWSPGDFIIMGILLTGTGLLCELAFRKIQNPVNRFILILSILAALFLIWAELAVGIFGSPFAGS